MSVVTIYGASDDLIEVEGPVPGCDEYNDEFARFRLIGDGKTTVVEVQYVESGVWEIRVRPLAEDVLMHEVAISQSERGYSALAIVAGVEQVVREVVS